MRRKSCSSTDVMVPLHEAKSYCRRFLTSSRTQKFSILLKENISTENKYTNPIYLASIFSIQHLTR